MNIKTKIIFVALIATILLVETVNAQFTPATRTVSLTGTEKTLLDRRISNYTVFTISIKELTDDLYSNGDAGQF